MIKFDPICRQLQKRNEQFQFWLDVSASGALYHLTKSESRIFHLVGSIREFIALRSTLDGLTSWRLVKIADRYASTRTR